MARCVVFHGSYLPLNWNEVSRLEIRSVQSKWVHHAYATGAGFDVRMGRPLFVSNNASTSSIVQRSIHNLDGLVFRCTITEVHGAQTDAADLQIRLTQVCITHGILPPNSDFVYHRTQTRPRNDCAGGLHSHSGSRIAPTPRITYRPSLKIWACPTSPPTSGYLQVVQPCQYTPIILG